MFKTIYGEHIDEITEKKSRFIAIAKGIKNEDDAKKFINEQRKIYYDARHVVYAYVISEGIKKYNDDGEPSSTAGIPILKILEHGNFFYTIVVVVRYFGGILLGTGGLIRAYSAAAKKVLETAHTLENESYEKIILTFDYGSLNKINYLLQKNNCCVEKISYNENVNVSFFVRDALADNLLTNLNEATDRKISILNKIKVAGTIIDKKFICCGDI